MQWYGGRRSSNIEDRRGLRLGTGIVGGGIGTVILIIAALFFGVDPGAILNNDPATPDALPAADTDDKSRDFVAAVVGYTEDTWAEIFRERGETYRAPILVLFTGAVRSACGAGSAAMGPFYCPEDEKVYLDLSFFRELQDRFHAPGDFAAAYVIAHEVGHHVQNLLNFSGTPLRPPDGRRNRNDASVQIELQADCLAGVWARHTEQSQRAKSLAFLDIGDLQEALNAASSIGDDKLQMEHQGYVVPETFTHGTAEQRMRWFKQGFDSGGVPACMQPR